MRFTRLGMLLLVVGWSCFVLALLVGSLGPAVLGTLLVAAVLAQRVSAPVVEVTREAPGRARVGEMASCVLSVKGPAGAPLVVEAEAPRQLRVEREELTRARGEARLVQEGVFVAPGVAGWLDARVRVQDPWGVVEDVLTVPTRAFTRVLPDTSGVEEGRRAGKRGLSTGSTKHRLATDWEPEIERLRDYQPGDKFRDIDWAHSTQFNKLIVREMARHQQLPVIVLLQATSSMRWRRRASKLETGIQSALAVLSAAQTAGLPVGLVAFDDKGVAAQVKAIASRKAVQMALDGLAALPSASEGEGPSPRVLDASVMLAATSEERAFLEAVSQFDASGARGVTPVEAALGALTRVSPQPALVVCILDVEETPAIARTVAARLLKRGHRPVVAGVASGAHHYTLREVDDDVASRLVTWRTNREAAAGACARQRVPFLTLGPTLTASGIREVIESARA